MEIEDFEKRQQPWYQNLEPEAQAYGKYAV